MNIRKPADYSVLFSELDKLIAAQLPQMELYREIGRVVSSRAEKGAAVAASEHLQVTYPAAEGFSPRNLRRMRDFYRMYGDAPELLAAAMRFILRRGASWQRTGSPATATRRGNSPIRITTSTTC